MNDGRRDVSRGGIQFRVVKSTKKAIHINDEIHSSKVAENEARKMARGKQTRGGSSSVPQHFGGPDVVVVASVNKSCGALGSKYREEGEQDKA